MCFEIKELYLSDEPKENGKGSRENFNTDVIVVATEDTEEFGIRRAKYVASFFTYANILELQTQHAKTGEYLNGKFFYSGNMVLIDVCSRENIRAVVDYLIEEGEFGDVFRRI